MNALAEENQAITKIERAYLKRNRKQIYIACEDLDFTWSLAEIYKFRKLWNDGRSIMEMEKELGRPQEEIAILILDQAAKGRIERRKNGIFG
mgnify:FL=1